MPTSRRPTPRPGAAWTTGPPMAGPESMRRPQAPTIGYGAIRSGSGSGVDLGSLAPTLNRKGYKSVAIGLQRRKILSFGAGKPDSVPRLAALRSSFLSRPFGPARPPSPAAGPRGDGRMRHTRDSRAGRPVSYFVLHRMGFFVPPASRRARWALTPPFHPCPAAAGAAWRSVFCDTVRRRGLNRGACACLSARAASCPVVSGLSSPNFYRARRYPRLGIKELGATTRPQS